MASPSDMHLSIFMDWGDIASHARFARESFTTNKVVSSDMQTEHATLHLGTCEMFLCYALRPVRVSMTGKRLQHTLCCSQAVFSCSSRVLACSSCARSLLTLDLSSCKCFISCSKAAMEAAWLSAITKQESVLRWKFAQRHSSDDLN